MSTKASTPTHEADAQRVHTPPPVMIEHVSLPRPPKNHVYIPIPEDIPVRTITGEGIQGLCRIDSGNLVDEFQSGLVEVITAVQTLGRKGKLKLALEIAPGGHNRVAIAFDVSASPPREKRHPAQIFCTPLGQLVSRDPDQMEMDLRHAPKPEQAPLRSVAPPEQPPLRTVA